MSDSEAADRPSDATISRTLRDVVVATHKTGRTEELTVKRIRAKAEEQLGLSAGFLKTNQEWKQKSHDAILEAVDQYCGDEPASDVAPAPKAKAKAKPPAKKAAKPKPTPRKAKTIGESASGVKRKSATPVKKPQKRRKTGTSSDEESDAVMSEASVKEDTLSDVESEPPQKLARRAKKVVTEASDEEERAPSPSDDQEEPANKQEASSAVEVKGDASDSEMSELIDESPVKKKKQAKKTAPNKGGTMPKTKGAAVAKSTAKASKTKVEDSPDQAEIKRLQSWLVKCGIRKVWVKELANCDTAKERIKHLKEMLKDAGMDGKYSNEKAATIKEQRGFAKDLEAIQEGAKAWGEGGEEDSGRPRRRLARGPPKPLPKYDLSDEDEDEEANSNASDDGEKAKTEDTPKKQGDDDEKVKRKAKIDSKVQPRAEDDDDSDEDVDFNDDSDEEVEFSSDGDASGAEDDTD